MKPPWGPPGRFRPAAAGPAVEVVSDPERPRLGRFLRTLRPCAPGAKLVVERHLCFVSTTGGLEGWQRHAELHRAITEGERGAGEMEGSTWGRWGGGLEQLRSANLHAGDKELAAGIRRELQAAAAEAPKWSEDLIEQMVWLACVFKVNSFSFPGACGLRNDEVFPTICRANHSCSPNAVIVPGKVPGESMLVAMRPIAKGDPVEISYLPAEYLIRNGPRRRGVLEEKFHFSCCCQRCQYAIDLSRRFAADCSACGTADFAADAGDSLQCLGCGKTIEDKAVVQQLCSEEADVEQLMVRLPETEDLELPAPDGLTGLEPPALERCLGFAARHGHHYLAAEILRRRVPALHSQGQYAEAANAQAAFVSTVKELLPRSVCGLAWLVELHSRLAFVLELAGRRKEACAALCEVKRHLEVASGQCPSPAAFFGLMESVEWIKLLQQVGPEVLV